MSPTTKTALFSALAALMLLGAGCQSLPRGTSEPELRSDWREVLARNLEGVAANSGLEYRGTPIGFIGEPRKCTAPVEPERARPDSDNLDTGHCGYLNVTIYENGVPRERSFGYMLTGGLFGYVMTGGPDGRVRFFVND